MNNPVIWFEIYVDDMPRARAFYERMLGITLESLNKPDTLDELEMWAFPMDMERVGAGGTLAKMAGMLSDCEAVTVPRVGHAPMLDEPAAVAAIDRLLARVK